MLHTKGFVMLPACGGTGPNFGRDGGYSRQASRIKVYGEGALPPAPQRVDQVMEISTSSLPIPVVATITDGGVATLQGAGEVTLTALFRLA